MCNKKRLGQTAALLLAGMAVGLAGGAFAAPTTNMVPVNWNVTPATNGAYRETFDAATAPTWDQLVETIATNSHVNVMPSRSNTWFELGGAFTNVMKIPADVSYINTLRYTGGITNVSFAANPVFVDMRIQFTAHEAAPPTDAKLAVFVSSTNSIHVVHNDGVTTNTWPDNNLLSDWHQLTVRLENGGKCAVLLDDQTVTNNLTPKAVGAANVLDSIEFANGGYVDELYVSHGNPNYPGTMGTIPLGVTGAGGLLGSTTNWLANYFNDGRLAPNAVFPGGIDLDRAYLLNMTLAGTPGAPTDPVTSVTFGVAAIDLVTPTNVIVTCRLKVNNGDRQDPINGRLRLRGKATIGGQYVTMNPDAISPKYTDFNDGLATYPFTVEPGMKFFKAQIVE